MLGEKIIIGQSDVKKLQKLDESYVHENLVEIRCIPHHWRNMISINTSTVKRSANTSEGWDRILHKRISNFFRLYTQVLNYQVHMLVSHGNLISVYDMSREEWVCTLRLGLDSYIRKMFIKKRCKNKRDLLLAGAKEQGNSHLGID